ncbi:MAG: hypothetical protein A3J93_04440 [Candidatus Magasanikbacteria bacterium RIFOXYC2_FULL_42_28]|uniref:DUF2304 domain-containing protein n=1 Tax=Candidatus Magasanikbacteria bacterium RIFOXYC2_FULL_42_28 TaxID=1798704 RepID=A0A1F6NXV2_9BACT|nr:MAG: hypothetical protein A3J93_04440 [Candidatus Magasanikbacteria bacterium RIFOXYC2_FULL_42_28]
MYLIQILLVAFSVFAIFKTIQKFRVAQLSALELAGWSLFWFLVMVVAILPDSASALAKLFGVGRGADLVVYLALALMFYLLFRLNVRMEKMKREITILTRALGLRADKNK